MSNSKQNKRKLIKISQAENVFRDYFDSYYGSNRNVKNISYRVMEDNDGFCVRLEYDNFAQYVNYYSNSAFSENPALVNSCFEFEYNNKRFLCHFVDVLDAVDSDDLSFYTYPKCAKDSDIKNAAENIMAASEKYMDILNSVAVSDDMKKQIFDDVYEDDFGDEDNDLQFTVEYMWDEKYFAYESLMTVDELRKLLKKQNRKGKLEKGFETRAYRVLSSLDKKEIKDRQAYKNSINNYSKKDRFLMYSPYVAAAIVFAIVFGIIGYEIDKNMFSQYIGKTHWESAIGLGAAGAVTSVVIVGLFEKTIYKLIVRKDYYDDFMQIVKTEAVPKWVEVVLYIFLIAFSILFIAVLCFNGIFFTQNGDIINKDFAFSQAETYSIKNVEIAVIEDSPESEYIDTAYAFKLDGEWVEYGVPDDESKIIIENSIEKYNVKTIKTEDFVELE